MMAKSPLFLIWTLATAAGRGFNPVPLHTVDGPR